MCRQEVLVSDILLLEIQVAHFLDTPIAAWASAFARLLWQTASSTKAWAHLEDVAEEISWAVISSTASLLTPLSTRLRLAPAQYHSIVLTSSLVPKHGDEGSLSAVQKISCQDNTPLPLSIGGIEVPWRVLSACGSASESLASIAWLHLRLPDNLLTPTHSVERQVDADAAVVFQQCTALRHLTLASDRFPSRTGSLQTPLLAAALSAMTALDTLRVQFRSLDAQELAMVTAALVNLPALRVLELPDHVDVSELSLLSAVATLPALECLLLPACYSLSTKFDDPQAQFLMPQLKSLCIRSFETMRVPLTRVFSSCCYLHSIQLHGQGAPNTFSAADLAQALAALSGGHLRSLCLSNSDITVTETSEVALGSVLTSLQRLTNLELLVSFRWTDGNADDDDEAGEELARLLADCSALVCLTSRWGESEMYGFSRALSATLPLLPTLTRCNLVRHPKETSVMDADMVSELLACTTLESLTLDIQKLGPDLNALMGSSTPFHLVAVPPRLCSLELRRCEIVRHMAGKRHATLQRLLCALSPVRSLEVLKMPNCSFDMGELVAGLMRLTQLRELDLSGCGLLHRAHGSPFIELVPALPKHLSTLNLSENGESTFAAGCSVGWFAIHLLSMELMSGALTHLQRLDLSGTGLKCSDVELLVGGIVHSPALSQLKICANSNPQVARLQDGAVRTLAQVLPAFNDKALALQRLDLSGQDCSDMALTQLKLALPDVAVVFGSKEL